MNAIDIANIVLYNKLITVDGLNNTNVFNQETFIDKDLHCFFYMVNCELIFANNFDIELQTKLVYDIKVWRKIYSETDTDYMANVIDNIDAKIRGQGISHSKTVQVQGQEPVTTTYLLSSCKRIDLLDDYFIAGGESWECRAGRYEIIIGGLVT